MANHRKYLNIDVLEAARERMAYIFDNFQEVQVSVSGGKDSTVLLYLAIQEAEKRNRKIECFFLDQEAEYQATIDVMRKYMSLKSVIPLWYQVPIYMTNSTSYSDCFLYAWGDGQKWMREKEKNSIHKINEKYPERFYEIFPWLEKKNPNKAYLVGLRAEEGIMRYRAVTKNPGLNGLKWTTRGDGDYYKFYPIYDWCWNDIWKFIYDYNLPYNKMYDFMFWSNYSMYKMRVSNLIHEKSYKCLKDLPKFEPETYDKLCKRIGGISTAMRYCSEKVIFSNKKLPSHYNSWKEFRDFLLKSLPDETQKDRFTKRFEKQPNNEQIFQKQVGQLLINDYENSKPLDIKTQQKINERKEKWMKLL